MMTSNLLSRLLPSNHQGRSIYEDLRAHDEDPDSDLEENAGLGIDEENLGYRDEELGNVDIFNGADSHITTASTPFLPGAQGTQGRGKPKSRSKPRSTGLKWTAQSPRLLEEDPDDDVPASLLIEDNDMAGPSTPHNPRMKHRSPKHPPIPGPSNRETRAHWEAAQAQQRLHQENGPNVGGPQPIPINAAFLSGSAREKAMWRWINVTNLDNFIREVYDYFHGAGVWCILTEKVTNLVKSMFVALFVTFTSQCVDYGKISSSNRLQDILVPQCTKKISGMPNLAIWLFTLHIFWRFYLLLTEIPSLLRIRDFYTYLLDVPEGDIQTISWQEVVARIMALRDSNPITAEKISAANRKYLGSQSKQRLDAHDIANRLMRRENYLIAMFNKDVLDLTLPIPFLQGRQFFSRSLLWNLDQCIMDLVFNEHGQVRQLILKDSHRRQLSDTLRRRFLFAGWMNVFLAPVLVGYFMVVYFLRYFNEFKTNPSAAGSRQYTPLAEWKFREFNELGHLFHKRVNMSYPFASRYLDQFPKVKTAHVARLVAFISGAIVSVLALATLLDPENFLSFEITSNRTVLFYMTSLGILWSIMNGMIPEENLVFEPEYALRNVIEYTHYMPNNWQNRLHSDEVRQEFATLYKLKIQIFLEEVFSIIITPFILWFSLPDCSDHIIDFFREFTVHVDGVGYVCSFAVFDFKKGNGLKAPLGAANADPRDDYYSTKDGKLAASYFGFLDNYALNPKTAVQGHVPPGTRHHQFNPPPSFPGLMSPTLAAEMQSSRMGRSERRPRAPGGIHPSRTPRFTPLGGNGSHPSPMQSILLDPHHQPTSSFSGAKSVNRGTRSKYQVKNNIIEEPEEEVPDQDFREESESAIGLDESRWETSPTKAAQEDGEGEESEVAGGGGVLGLLYQFQKAQTDGRPGVNI